MGSLASGAFPSLRDLSLIHISHEMNYKKVMRYLRLNSLVPELLDKMCIRDRSEPQQEQTGPAIPESGDVVAVSYTHLDVYKRQIQV